MSKKKMDRTLQSAFAPTYREVRKIGTPLIDLHMWCWGCDVRRAEGNLLLEYGFEKRPAPDPHYRSAYDVPLSPTCVLTLWAWGMWIAEETHGSLLISRDRFRLRAAETAHYLPQARREGELPACVPVQNDATWERGCPLLGAACTWAAGYERWVAEHTEPGYRRQTWAHWPQRRCYPDRIGANEITGTWDRVAELAHAPKTSVSELKLS